MNCIRGRTPLLVLAALAALSLSAAPAARAQQTSAVTISGGIVENAGENYNAISGAAGTSFCLGWSFTVASPVAVTALGIYDDNNTALDINGNPTPGTAMAASHQVGIFSDSTGTLLVQATVAPADTPYAAFSGLAATSGQLATDGTGVQLFRYNSNLKDGATGLVTLPEFVLQPGVTYDIAAVTGLDNYAYFNDTFAQNSPIVYKQDQYYSAGGNGNTTTLQAPTQSYQGGDGSAFFGPNFQFTAAPEPSPVACLALGVLGLATLGWKARRRA